MRVPPWFLVQLSETIDWCALRVRTDDPRGCLRSIDLLPLSSDESSRRPTSTVPRDSLDRIHIETGMISNLVTQRHALVGDESRPDELVGLRGGRLLLVAYEYSNDDGAAQDATGGFLDALDGPPWDSWVAALAGPNDLRILVSWVPRGFVRLVDRGIAEDCMGMLCWADMADGTGSEDRFAHVPPWLQTFRYPLNDRDRLQGVWRHDSVDPVDKTYIVFDADEFRRPDPDRVHYLDEPIDRETFSLKRTRLAGFCGWLARLGIPVRVSPRLVVHRPAFEHLPAWDSLADYELRDDLLTIRWHDPPETYTYVRETDPGLAARLSQRPVRIERPTIDHAVLGRTAWDQNLGWWEAAWEAHEGAHVSADGPADPDPGFFDHMASTAAAVAGRIEDLKRYASDHLLDLKNDTWRQEDEPVLTDDEFVSKLTPVSLGIYKDGIKEVDFDNELMFLGCSIVVQLDADLTPTSARIDG